MFFESLLRAVSPRLSFCTEILSCFYATMARRKRKIGIVLKSFHAIAKPVRSSLAIAVLATVFYANACADDKAYAQQKN